MSHAHRRSREESQLASLTGIPPENVYVHATFIGGGFGGRGGWGTTGALQITQGLRGSHAPHGKAVKLLLGRVEGLRVGVSSRPTGVWTLTATLGADWWA